LIVDTGRDGIDIDCCEDVVVEDSWFNTPHDDSIVLKSSNALGYRRPTTNVRIRRCLVTGGFVPGTLYDGRRLPIDAASGMKARIKIGTESCWGFDGVSIDSCAIWNALGIALLTVDGGALKNVALRDIGMRNIQDAPLFMRLGARLRAPAGAAVEAFAGITVERLACNGFGQPLTISGIPGHPITNIALRNIELTAHQGASNAAAGGWMPVGEAPLPPGNVPPEKASDYPEAGMFGALPAQFVFARHVDGLEIDGLRLKQIGADHSMPSAATATAGDSRPLFWFADVQGGRFAGIEVPPGTAEPVCVSDSACTLSPATTDERARVN
jgi:hypothetical protein